MGSEDSARPTSETVETVLLMLEERVWRLSVSERYEVLRYGERLGIEGAALVGDGEQSLQEMYSKGSP